MRHRTIVLPITCAVLLATGLLLFLRLMPSDVKNGHSSAATQQEVVVDSERAKANDNDVEASKPTDAPVDINISGVMDDYEKTIVDREVLNAEDILHLEGVLPYDKKIAAKFDMPLDEIKTAKSSVLCKHYFLRTPGKVLFGLYDDRNFGITRAIRASATLSALVNREDVVDGMCEYNRDILDNEIENKQHEPGKISRSLMCSDELLMYPAVFVKTIDL